MLNEKGNIVLDVNLGKSFKLRIIQTIIFFVFTVVGGLGLFFIFAVAIGLSFGALTMPLSPFLLLPIALVYALFRYHTARQYKVFENGIEYKDKFYQWNDFNIIRESRFNFLHGENKRYVTYLRANNYLSDIVANEIIFLIPSEQLHIFSSVISDHFHRPNWLDRNKNALLRSLIFVIIPPVTYFVYWLTGDENMTITFMGVLLLITFVFMGILRRN